MRRKNRKYITVGGIKIRLHQPPPPKLNLRLASRRRLAKHGIPKRPDPKRDPAAYALWKKLYLRPLNFVHPFPTTGPNSNPTPIPNSNAGFRLNARQALNMPTDPGGPFGTSYNWSGILMQSPRPGDRFTMVGGTWAMHNVNTPGHRCDEMYYDCSIWIGIDGHNSGDILQMGSAHNVICRDGQPSFQNSLWWEWLPAGPIPINFSFATNEVLHFQIETQDPTKAVCYITSRDTINHTSFTAHAGSGISLKANSAEWIVERPEINGSLSELADFGMVEFSDASANTTSEGTVNASLGGMLDMTNTLGDKIATASIVNPTDITVTF